MPPSAMARSVIPITDPPLIETLVESCVAMDPNPNDVLTVAPDSATQFNPFPTIKLPSVTASVAISDNPASYS